MTWLIIFGVVVTLCGIAGLGMCIARAAKLRGLADQDEMRAGMHTLVALNMASVGLAGLGLALVVVGLIL